MLVSDAPVFILGNHWTTFYFAEYDIKFPLDVSLQLLFCLAKHPQCRESLLAQLKLEGLRDKEAS
jgi:hypothetical protein